MASTTRKPPHYTVHEPTARAGGPDGFDAREKLSAELEGDAYVRTFRVRLDVRSGSGRWRECKTLDVLHFGEDDDDTPNEVRATELVEKLLELCDEATGDGNTSARASGYGERAGRVEWSVAPWTIGDAPSGDAIAVGRESLASMMASMSRSYEAMVRALDRSIRTTNELVDARVRQAEERERNAATVAKTILEVSTETAKRLQEAAAPTVELRRIELEQAREANEHTAELERERLNHESLMHAVEVVANAMADNAGKSSSATTVASDDACEPAKRLAKIVDSLDDDARAKVTEEIGEDAWSALLRSCKASQLAEFDASFGAAYGLLSAGGREAAQVRFAKLQPLLGPRVLTLHNLITEHEGRRS